MLELLEAQISLVEFFPLPLCFHPLVGTKLASDAQIEMHTVTFLWLYKYYGTCLHTPICVMFQLKL